MLKSPCDGSSEWGVGVGVFGVGVVAVGRLGVGVGLTVCAGLGDAALLQATTARTHAMSVESRPEARRLTMPGAYLDDVATPSRAEGTTDALGRSRGHRVPTGLARATSGFGPRGPSRSRRRSDGP